MLASGRSSSDPVKSVSSIRTGAAAGRRLLTAGGRFGQPSISMLADPPGDETPKHSSEKDPNHWATHLTLNRNPSLTVVTFTSLRSEMEEIGMEKQFDGVTDGTSCPQSRCFMALAAASTNRGSRSRT